jgi:hypothetical protein
MRSLYSLPKLAAWKGGKDMNRLDMTMEETELVQGILRGYLATLDSEIDHTNRWDFRRMLKDRRYVILQLVERCSTLPTGDEPMSKRETRSGD